MNIKKALLTGTSYAAVAAVAISGTVAYLNDQTETDVNVMTMGNVSIEQIEQERDANGDLVDFTQGKVAIPAVGTIAWDEDGVDVNGTEYKVFTDELSNVIDKIVTVKNTGKTDAYVRTIVAIEAPDYDPNDLIHFNWNDEDSSSKFTNAEINGVEYVLVTFTYDEALASNEISAPSFMQTFLDSKATNEDVAKFGDTWEILVLSQAVQADENLSAADMLDDAFGEVNAANAAEWFADSVTVAAPAAGAVRPAGYAPATEGETIDNLVVIDESDETTNLRALYKNGLTGDVTVTNSYLDGTYAMNLTAVEGSGAVLTVEDTALRGWVSYDGFATASFTDCTFDQNSNPEIYKTIRPYVDTVFTNCDFAEGYEFWLDKLGLETNGTTITLVDCTIGGVEITSADQLNIVHGDASSVVIG